MAEEIALTTIYGIEIATVGEEWQAATGPFTMTQERINSVIASQEDPTIKAPRNKLGHFDDRFTPELAGLWDGQPVMGKYINLRTSTDGKTLIGDLAGCPAWWAQVAPAAWPSRSGEWVLDYTSDAGKFYPCVLPAVACLSVTLPAISKIEDLPAIFTAQIPRGLRVDGKLFTATQSREKVIHTAVSAPDVTASFLKDFAQGDYYYYWPTRVYINPSAVIATDDGDEDHTEYFIPYTASRDGITWGEPVAAKHQYIDADSGTVLAGKTPAAVYTSRADLVPDRRTTTTSKESTVPDRDKDRETKVDETPESRIDGAALRTLLRLPEDADDDKVNEALLEQATAPAEDEEDKGRETTEVDDESKAVLTAMRDGRVTVISTSLYEAREKRLEELEKFVKTAQEESARDRQEGKVRKLITGGWITSAERDYYIELASENERAFDRLAEKLMTGKPRVPLRERGENPEPATVNTSQGTGLFPELDQREDD